MCVCVCVCVCVRVYVRVYMRVYVLVYVHVCAPMHTKLTTKPSWSGCSCFMTVTVLSDDLLRFGLETSIWLLLTVINWIVNGDRKPSFAGGASKLCLPLSFICLLMCPSVALSWSIFLSVCLCCCFSMLQSLCLCCCVSMLQSLSVAIFLFVAVSLFAAVCLSVAVSFCLYQHVCLLFSLSMSVSLSMFVSESSKTVFPSCGLGVLFIVWEKLYEIRKQPRGQEREKTSMRCCCLRGTHTHTLTER